ncbi:MAG TPA: hypothetical protein VLF67_04385, partial [Candidatus Saccharimonas sp.]|nr:hypothetical protein [Candidatus Saccharimonas sp.]
MPRAKRTRQASNPRRLILPLGVVTVLVVAVWVALSSGVSLGKTYADGWNDYTFRYPSNATLAAGDTTGGLVYVLPPGAKVADLGGCIVQYSSDPNARYNLPNFDSFRPLPSASYNGLTWHGTVFTSKSAAGDTKYYMWASGHLSVQARDPYADM